VNLDASMIEGKTWIYPHPRDEAKFGRVELSFSSGRVTARNSQSGASGLYEYRDDMLCIFLDRWGTTCYFVLGAGEGRKLFFPQGGFLTPLEIKS
jgi:hypothetical protein